jgi:hypothetical protein
MPAEPTITCPTCRAEIKLTESLAAPLIAATKHQYESLLAKQREDVAKREQTIAAREQQLAKDKESVDAAVAEKLKAERDKLSADAAKREQAMKAREDQLAKERESLDTSVAEKLKAERAKIAADEARKAKLALGNDLEQKAKELADLQQILKQRDEKLAEAQKAQAELLKKQRELDDAKRELELTVEKRVTESLAATREQAKKEAEEKLGLKVIEKDQLIEQLGRKVEELQKKMEQGSQQAQGEALELQIESILREKFPHDSIDAVPKGEHGGDVLQRVITPTGTTCGSILWETKRTKNWSDGWLAKLREDQRAAKAEICVIVSAVLPKGVETFDQIDSVWIVHPRCIVPVAMSLRHMLIEVNCARQASEGQHTKMELVYHYLTGPKFRLRVQAIVEAFGNMADDLAKEKKAMTRQWAKREMEIERMMEATVGMYGELQGIAGKSLQEIDGLALDVQEGPGLLASRADGDE